MASEWMVLNDGTRMPSVGLGTFQGNYDYSNIFERVVESVADAIDIGYRHFDTAYLYNTEKPLGQVINDKIQSGPITRDAVYITTKLWSTSHRRADVVLALEKSLTNLSLEYVDLFLIHWPIALKSGEDTMPKDENGQPIYEDDQTDITETWQGMIDCQEQGLCKSIGVSNFNIKQLQKLIDFGKVVPANNQASLVTISK